MSVLSPAGKEHILELLQFDFFLRDGQKGGWRWLRLGSLDLSGSMQLLLGCGCSQPKGLPWELPGNLSCALADTRVPQETKNTPRKAGQSRGHQHSSHPEPGHPKMIPALGLISWRRKGICSCK